MYCEWQKRITKTIPIAHFKLDLRIERYHQRQRTDFRTDQKNLAYEGWNEQTWQQDESLYLEGVWRSYKQRKEAVKQA